MTKKVKPKFKGTVTMPFIVNNILYNIGDIFESEHESSIKYLITLKKLK
jgi:hypothetical protein